MSLHFTLASSLSLLASLLVVAPAFADEPPAPPPPPPPPAAAAVAAPPAYVLPPAQGPGAPGPWMVAPGSQPLMIREEHRASPALIVGGALTTFAGLGTTALGSLLYIFNTTVVCDQSGSCGGSPAPGVVLMAGGVLAMAGGVTMIVFGARKVTTPLPETSLRLRPTGADLQIVF